MLGTEFKPTDAQRGENRAQAGIGNIHFIDWDAFKECELYAAVNRKARNRNSGNPERVERSQHTYENLAVFFDVDYQRILAVVATIPVNERGYFISPKT